MNGNGVGGFALCFVQPSLNEGITFKIKTSRYNHDYYGIDVANIDERQSTINDDCCLYF